MSLTTWKKIYLFGFFIICTIQVFCQHNDSLIPGKESDTTRPDFIRDLQRKGFEITDRNVKKYKAEDWP